MFVYFCSQNQHGPMGLALSRFDADSGTLSTPQLVAQTPDPAVLTIGRGSTHLYLCNTGTPGGVSAFAIERSSGALNLLNHIVSKGRGPSHIVVDHSGRFVLDANYGGGYVEVLALAADGSLDTRTAMIEHAGSSVHPQRQTKPYAHWFGVDPSNRFALAADLGTDRIVIYRFDDSAGTLTPHAHASVAAGSGPRHLAWHPNGRIAYVIQELTNEIIVFTWDPTLGQLHPQQTVSTLPADFQGANTAAEIAVHPNGRFLYASNRGHDSLAMYEIDAASGHLSLRQLISARGRTPRFFVIDPSHRWLIVNNQDSNDVFVFALDVVSGLLAAHGDATILPRPMGLAFLD